MSEPTIGDVDAAKRLARYLSNCPGMVTTFKWQIKPGYIEGWSDSDWAGCLRTRKSTSGGLLKWGGHVIKGWSATQNVISLSSGEAEFYAMVKAASQLIGMRVMMQDWGIFPKAKMITDATAAMGMAQRKGMGNVRHLETSQMWIQDKVFRRDLEIEKIGGKVNIADALTKHVDSKALAVHVEGIKLERRSGRHVEAPEVASDEVVGTVIWDNEQDWN